jgi:hypothetical protein
MRRMKPAAECRLLAYSVEKLQNALTSNSCESAPQSTTVSGCRARIDWNAHSRAQQQIAIPFRVRERTAPLRACNFSISPEKGAFQQNRPVSGLSIRRPPYRPNSYSVGHFLLRQPLRNHEHPLFSRTFRTGRKPRTHARGRRQNPAVRSSLTRTKACPAYRTST